MYATPGSYKIHLNSQITDIMVSSSATRFTSKAENIHGEDVSPLKEKAFENTKKPLGCLEFRRNSTSFYQLLLMEKNPAPLRMPEMYFFLQVSRPFFGHPKWCRILFHQLYYYRNTMEIINWRPWEFFRETGFLRPRSRCRSWLGPNLGICVFDSPYFFGGDGPLWLCVFSIKNGVHLSTTENMKYLMDLNGSFYENTFLKSRINKLPDLKLDTPLHAVLV